MPHKRVFTRIIGDSRVERRFARVLDECSDVISYAKNALAVHVTWDDVNADGDMANDSPDVLVKRSHKRIGMVETTGQEDLDVPLKMERLRQWCEDINRVQPDVTYDVVYVDEESFEQYNPTACRPLVDGFRAYEEHISRGAAPDRSSAALQSGR